MKVFLPFKIKGIGGTATFAKKFKEGMGRHGHEVFFEYRSDYDILLIIAQAPFKYLIEAKRKGKKIVQRLDGTYYWSTVGPKFFLYNLKAIITRHLFADFTIYQSEYSKYCAENFLGKKMKDFSTIIYNGVDTNLFSPEGKKFNLRDNPQQQVFFTASAFRREEQIIPLLEALKIYKQKHNDNFKFIVAGTFTPNVSYIPEKYRSFKNASFIGKLENGIIPKFERAADIFLFSQLNPPCPNVVIESLACGLPICGIADGAMKELICNGIEGYLLPTMGNAFWKHRAINTENFSSLIMQILKKRHVLSEAARQKAISHFSLDHMVDRYIEALEVLIKTNHS